MPTYPDVAWFSLAPDWALIDRTRKQEIYRQHGVTWLWFVDPAGHTIEVLSRGENGWMVAGVFGGEGEARIPPFDAVPIDVGAIWEIQAPAPQTP
jgi:Uma2 family endonuclease